MVYYRVGNYVISIHVDDEIFTVERCLRSQNNVLVSHHLKIYIMDPFMFEKTTEILKLQLVYLVGTNS